MWHQLICDIKASPVSEFCCVCGIPHTYMRYDSFMCVRHDLFMCLTCLQNFVSDIKGRLSGAVEIYIYVYICIYVYEYIYVHIYVYISRDLLSGAVDIYVYIYIYMCVNIYMYIYIYIYVSILRPALRCSWVQHVSFVRVTWLNNVCDMTYLYIMRHNPFICETCPSIYVLWGGYG